jgi:hypothetical protein
MLAYSVDIIQLIRFRTGHKPVPHQKSNATVKLSAGGAI